jgi:long-chain acyl-CoA synthetase
MADKGVASAAVSMADLTGTLCGLFDEAVTRHASRPCIDFMDRVTSFRELGVAVEAFANGLRAMGVGPGVQVGLCLPNCTYSAIAFFGVLKAGGTVVNFNPLYVEKELEAQIADSRTSIMVTIDVPAVLPKVAAVARRTGLKKVIVCSMARALPVLKGIAFRLLKRKDIAPWTRDGLLSAFEDVLAMPRVGGPVAIPSPDDVAVLQYTGGTTGIPKGAMLTHGNLYANAEQCHVLCALPEDRQEILLGVLPLFHVFAMTTVMLMGLKIGALMIFRPRPVLDDMLKVIRTKRPTIFPGVPTIFIGLNSAKPKPEDMRSLSFCVSGGAPLPLEVKLEFEKIAGCTLVEGYGLTETSPVAAANPPNGLVKAGSIGVPLVGTTIELRNPETGALVHDAHMKGEICISGPQVMKGYWNRPDETAATFIGRALRTGDIAYRDEDGYFYIVDRIKDLILCSGYNVYPRVIEEALYQHPAVAEAIVIGIPDGYRGQAPKAFVKLREGAEVSTDDLMTHLAGHISKIEMPKEIEIRDSLPKTMVGKLSKKELVAEEAAKHAS